MMAQKERPWRLLEALSGRYRKVGELPTNTSR
jgi:hypothetical protein